MGWPESELAYWSAFFSIDDNGDKPLIKQRAMTIQESKDALRGILM